MDRSREQQSRDGLNQNFSSIMNVSHHNQTLMEKLKEKILHQFIELQKYILWKTQNSQGGLSGNNATNNGGQSPLGNQSPQMGAQQKDAMLAQINVDPEEFAQYKKMVQEGYAQYTQNRRSAQQNINGGALDSYVLGLDGQQQQQSQQYIGFQIDLECILKRCFQLVPACYFEENFEFQFKKLQHDLSSLNEMHDDLTEYLDEVEINLFYQIYNRFNEFLTVILNLNQMRQSIDEMLIQIHSIKRFNGQLRQRTIASGVKGYKQQKRANNFQLAVDTLKLLKTVHKTIPTLQELVQSNKFEYAVIMLREAESIYNEKFRGILALATYRDQITSARQKLQANISTQFQEKLMNMLQLHQIYQKHDAQGGGNSSRLDDSSLMINSAMLNDTFEHGRVNVSVLEESSRLSHLNWQHANVRRERNKEDAIGKLVVHAYQLPQFRPHKYRVQLQETLKQFHKSYLQDLKEHSEYILAKNGIVVVESDDLLQKIHIDLFTKFVMFYSEIIKRIVLRQLYVNQTTISQLLSANVQNQVEFFLQSINNIDGSLTNSSESAQEKTLSSQPNAKLSEVIDEFYQIVVRLFEFLNSKVTSLLQTRKLGETSEEFTVPQLRRLTGILAFWGGFVHTECTPLLKIQLPVRVKQQLTNSEHFAELQAKLVQNEEKKLLPLIDKFNNHNASVSANELLKQILETRTQLEKKFLENFHNQQMQSLKNDLETDRWAPHDIAFEFYDILAYIYNERERASDNLSLLNQTLTGAQQEQQSILDDYICTTDQVLVYNNTSELFGGGLSAHNGVSGAVEEQMGGPDTQRLLEETNETPRLTQPATPHQPFARPSNLSFDNNHQIPLVLTAGTAPANDEVLNEDNDQNQFKEKLRLKIMKNELHINGQRFKLTNALTQFIKRLYAYLHVLTFFKTCRADCITNIIEALKQYNSFSTQLIIRGGLTALEPSRKITSKNLAISSLCLNFALMLFEPLKKRIQDVLRVDGDRAAMTETQLEDEFTAVKKNYLGHINEIFDTIGNILRDIVRKSCTNIKGLQWNNPTEKINTPTRFTAEILQNLRNLYLAIEDFYGQEDLHRIFARVIREINEIYVRVFQNLDITSKVAAKRIKDELQYVASDLAQFGIIKNLATEKSRI